MLSDYLPAFTVASQRSPARVYLDLFAGTDHNESRETGERIRGSLRRALETTPEFTVVRGFELSPQRASSLEAAYRTEFPSRDLRIFPGDVHNSLGQALSELAATRDPDLQRAATFAFVDPDGVEARWSLLKMLAGHKHPASTKVELFILLASSQIGRVVHDRLDPQDLERAELLISNLFGTDGWRPILDARRRNRLDAPQARDELTNLMRWRLETDLGYKYTHTVRLTNTHGTPLYDMVFATDHDVGHKIMKDVYKKAAGRFPQMRQQARARLKDKAASEIGDEGLFSSVEALGTEPLLRGEQVYVHEPPVLPYGWD